MEQLGLISPDTLLPRIKYGPEKPDKTPFVRSFVPNFWLNAENEFRQTLL